jgi:hypothetical protein
MATLLVLNALTILGAMMCFSMLMASMGRVKQLERTDCFDGDLLLKQTSPTQLIGHRYSFEPTNHMGNSDV